MQMNYYSVITTINHPTKAVREVAKRMPLIVVGDEKTPKDWNYENAIYIPFVKNKGWFEGYDPPNHYARKNMGYLDAIKRKPDCILDIDDDTYPNETFNINGETIKADISGRSGWFNVYAALSGFNIWPRGFSLQHINDILIIENKDTKIKSSIQQGLVDIDPDVDAIWRLVLNREHYFLKNKSIFLKPFSWCPFNSQATKWFPDAYPLMYLPVYSTFRMCDIWRSFVAQRCLWQMNDGISFHSPSEFTQERNEHNLLDDFKDEIPGYLNNDIIIRTLSELELGGDIFDNMIACYQAVINKGILPEMEMRSLLSWIKKYKLVTNEI